MLYVVFTACSETGGDCTSDANCCDGLECGPMDVCICKDTGMFYIYCI